MRKRGKKKKVKYKGGIESNKKGHMIMSRQRAKHLYSDKSTGFMALCLPIFFLYAKNNNKQSHPSNHSGNSHQLLDATLTCCRCCCCFFSLFSLLLFHPLVRLKTHCQTKSKAHPSKNRYAQ